MDIMVLGQGNIGEGIVCTVGGAMVTLCLLLVKRGFTVRVGNEGNSHKNGNHRERNVCPVHEQFAKSLDERHDAMMQALSKIESGIVRLHQRMDGEKVHRPHG